MNLVEVPVHDDQYQQEAIRLFTSTPCIASMAIRQQVPRRPRISELFFRVVTNHALFPDASRIALPQLCPESQNSIASERAFFSEIRIRIREKDRLCSESDTFPPATRPRYICQHSLLRPAHYSFCLSYYLHATRQELVSQISLCHLTLDRALPLRPTLIASFSGC